MDPLLERAERLAVAVGVDHDLAVEHVAPGREAQLGEVAGQVLRAARLQAHARRRRRTRSRGSRRTSARSSTAAPSGSVVAARASCGSIPNVHRARQPYARVSVAVHVRLLESPMAPELTDAERAYLETLFWLHEAGLPMTAANVARAMQLVRAVRARDDRPPRARRPASRAAPTRSIELHRRTASARREEIVSRHRLIERFLTDVLGIPWDEVHEEAERLEHAMSPVLEERMLAAIGDATHLPARPPDPRRLAHARACRSPTSARARRSACCASRTRPRTCCTTCARPVSSRGSRAPSLESGEERDRDRRRRTARCAITRSVAETVSVDRRPLAAAACRAARAARARRRSATAAERRRSPTARQRVERRREPRDALADLARA